VFGLGLAALHLALGVASYHSMTTLHDSPAMRLLESQAASIKADQQDRSRITPIRDLSTLYDFIVDTGAVVGDQCYNTRAAAIDKSFKAHAMEFEDLQGHLWGYYGHILLVLDPVSDNFANLPYYPPNQRTGKKWMNGWVKTFKDGLNIIQERRSVHEVKIKALVAGTNDWSKGVEACAADLKLQESKKPSYEQYLSQNPQVAKALTSEAVVVTRGVLERQLSQLMDVHGRLDEIRKIAYGWVDAKDLYKEDSRIKLSREIVYLRETIQTMLVIPGWPPK
jgi:hypothetical protein